MGQAHLNLILRQLTAVNEAKTERDAGRDSLAAGLLHLHRRRYPSADGGPLVFSEGIADGPHEHRRRVRTFTFTSSRHNFRTLLTDHPLNNCRLHHLASKPVTLCDNELAGIVRTQRVDGVEKASASLNRSSTRDTEVFIDGDELDALGIAVALDGITLGDGA
jgi:hypothetical protein